MKANREEIFLAAKKGDLTFIQSQNVDENITDEDGANCLHYACRGPSVDLVKYLVDQQKFDVLKTTKFGSTLFHEAAAVGSLDIVKWLWSKSEVNIDKQDLSGATPLHVAALYGQIQIVHWIINNTSCDLLIKTEKNANCLHFGVVGGNLKLVKIILAEIPRAINLQLDNGTTAAYLASQFGYLDILKFLIEKGGQLNMKSFDGMSCLHAACQGGHLEVVKWLVKEQKCNINDRDLDGASCLHFAATNGRAKVVEWMVKEGGAKVTLDNLGGSPLHNAAELGHFEVIKALLDNGCNKEITDNDGLTAAELALKCHHSSCAALIRGEFEFKDSSSDKITRSASINRSVVNSNGNHNQISNQSIVQIHNSTDNLKPHNTNVHSSSNHVTSPDKEEFTDFILPTNPHSSINHVTSQNEESTEYILPEPDYPDDDESENLIVHADDYKTHQLDPENYEPPELPPDSQQINSDTYPEPDSHQIDPDTYEPPDLPPDLDSDKGSQTDITTLNLKDTKDIHDVLKSPRKDTESDISSATSTLSSTSKQDIVTRSKASDIIVKFESQPHYISSPTHSDKGFNYKAYSRVGPPPAILSPKSVVIETHSSKDTINVNGDQQPHSLHGIQHENTTPNSRTETSPHSSPRSKPVLNVNYIGRHNMSQNLAKTNLLTELKQLHGSRSSLEDIDVNDEEETVPTRNNENGNHTHNRPASMTNGERSNSLRPALLTTSSSTGSLSSMGNQSPVIAKNLDLVEELKKKDLSDLRVIKKPGEANPVKMVFSFGEPPSSKKPNSSDTLQKKNNEPQKEPKSKSPVLTGEFDPKNFLDKVPDTDSNGVTYPLWKKQRLARQLAEKALKEYEEKKKEEEKESRFKNMPAWKRQMIERKEAQSK